MNAKHLFLTLIIGALSVSAWGDEVHQATDIISSSTLAAECSLTEDDFHAAAVSGLSFVTDAQYSAPAEGLYFSSSDGLFGIAPDKALVVSSTKSKGKIVSISIVWKNDDAYNYVTDDGMDKAILKLYARNGSAYPSSASIDNISSSELRHTFTYKDGHYTYNFTGSGYEYIALVADGNDGTNYGAFFTSINITWEWTEKTEYTISAGTIKVGEDERHTFGSEVTVSPATAYAGETITVTFRPGKSGTGFKASKYSLVSYTFDDIVFEQDCGAYTTNPDTKVVEFPMPARNVTIDAEFQVLTFRSSSLTIDKTNNTVGSGETLIVPFTLLDNSGNPIPDYIGTIKAESSDEAIVSADAPVKVSDGHYTMTVHGKAMGNATITVTASPQGLIKGSTDEITITVTAREVAIVAEYNDHFYAMKNTVADKKAAKLEIFCNPIIGAYYYDANLSLSDVTWNIAEPEAESYYIQNPNNSGKFLTVYKGNFTEGDVAYEWWKDAEKDQFKTSEGNYSIQCTSSGFVSRSDVTDASAYEILVADFLPLNYTTSTGASIIDTRTLKAADYGTMCVPFNVSSSNLTSVGAKFYKLAGKTVKDDKITSIVINEDPETSLVAGQSYIYVMDEGATSINLTGSAAFAMAADNQNDGLVGCLPGDVTAEGKMYVPGRDDRVNGCYGLSKNTLRFVQKGALASIKPYRAYIDASQLEVITSAGVPRRRMVLAEDFDGDFGEEAVFTGADELNIEAFINWKEPVYNIMGVQVGKGAKGVLIQNGQKFLIQ